MTTSESDEGNKSELSSKLGNPAGRGGSDAEMAATILYLAGPGGLFCNGEVIHPDVSIRRSVWSSYYVYMRLNAIADKSEQGGNLLVAPSAM